MSVSQMFRYAIPFCQAWGVALGQCDNRPNLTLIERLRILSKATLDGAAQPWQCPHRTFLRAVTAGESIQAGCSLIDHWAETGRLYSRENMLDAVMLITAVPICQGIEHVRFDGYAHLNWKRVALLAVGISARALAKEACKWHDRNAEIERPLLLAPLESGDRALQVLRQLQMRQHTDEQELLHRLWGYSPSDLLHLDAIPAPLQSDPALPKCALSGKAVRYPVSLIGEPVIYERSALLSWIQDYPNTPLPGSARIPKTEEVVERPEVESRIMRRLMYLSKALDKNPEYQRAKLSWRLPYHQLFALDHIPPELEHDPLLKTLICPLTQRPIRYIVIAKNPGTGQQAYFERDSLLPAETVHGRAIAIAQSAWNSTEILPGINCTREQALYSCDFKKQRTIHYRLEQIADQLADLQGISKEGRIRHLPSENSKKDFWGQQLITGLDRSERKTLESAAAALRLHEQVGLSSDHPILRGIKKTIAAIGGTVNVGASLSFYGTLYLSSPFALVASHILLQQPMEDLITYERVNRLSREMKK
jgi:hypothetical protein